jgi:hypothetical protein
VGAAIGAYQYWKKFRFTGMTFSWVTESHALHGNVEQVKMVTYLEGKENFHRNLQKIICSEYDEYFKFAL